MRQKKKLILLSSLTIASLLVAGFLLGTNGFKMSLQEMRGSGTEYNLVGNKSNNVSEQEATNGSKVLVTNLGNNLPLNLHNVEHDQDGGFIRLPAAGSYFEVADNALIKGITNIQFTVKGRYSMALGLYAGGSYKADTIEKRFCSNGDNWLTLTKEYSFETPVNYFRFENVDSKYCRIDSFTITYSCEEANSSRILEVNSKDMLTNATAGDKRSIFGGSPYTVDFYNNDLGASTSGYSFKVTGDAAADGWPTALINLNKKFDFSDKGFSFNVKFVDLYKWISFTFYDSSWSEITKFEADISGTGWVNYVFPHSKLVNGLAQFSRTEADLADVNLVKVCLNFDQYKGKTQSVIIDEMHPAEEALISSTKVLNFENYKTLDVGECKNSTIVTDYTDSYGPNSISCKKVTFENITGGYGMTNTIVFQPNNDHIDFTNGTFEFDLKTSTSLMFGSGSNKHAFQIKVLSDWGAGQKSSWIDIHVKGASGYTNGYTDDGWFHISIDMVSRFGSLNADSIRVYLAIGGVSADNKADVSVKYDNITFTRNA